MMELERVDGYHIKSYPLGILVKIRMKGSGRVVHCVDCSCNNYIITKYNCGSGDHAHIECQNCEGRDNVLYEEVEFFIPRKSIQLIIPEVTLE